MQIVQQKGNIIEKVIRDKAGKLVRAKFFVYESAGRVKARLVSFTYLEELALLSAGSIFLPIYNKVKSNLIEFFAKRDVVYRFATISNLYFSGSKPRAPSF